MKGRGVITQGILLLFASGQRLREGVKCYLGKNSSSSPLENKKVGERRVFPSSPPSKVNEGGRGAEEGVR